MPESGFLNFLRTIGLRSITIDAIGLNLKVEDEGLTLQIGTKEKTEIVKPATDDSDLTED
jgi:hypothetical protein